MGAFTIKVNGEKKTQELPIADHQVAVDLMLKELVENNIVASLDEIKGAGLESFRVVLISLAALK